MQTEPGDHVEADEPIAQIETDKVILNSKLLSIELKTLHFAFSLCQLLLISR